MLYKAPQLFQHHFGKVPALVVADANTFKLAGRSVQDGLSRAGHACLEPFIYSDPALYAEHRFVAQLEERLNGNHAIPVAVGSGTINDLTKLAAHRTARSYLCVATAASMDGYTAFGASITHKGLKQTFTCPAPRAVLADTGIIAHAPAEMNAAGYADLLAKVTAGADWILADALGVEHIHREAWHLVQGGLRELLAQPKAVADREPRAVGLLVEGLMLSGFAMQAAQSSRAASGAEHQFSHLWDMEHHTHNGQTPSHGFKVGIATLAVTALYEYLLQQPLQELDVDECCAVWADEARLKESAGGFFADRALREAALHESSAKQISRDALRTQLLKLQSMWPEVSRKLRAQLMPLAEVKAKLRAVGAPSEPEQIGITRERLCGSFIKAWFIRRRFTVLDVIVRVNRLDDALLHMFGPDGAWPLGSPLLASDTPGLKAQA